MVYYHPLKVGRPEKWTKEAIEKEAEALLEWIKKPDSKYLKTFTLERGYPFEYFHRFVEKSEIFCQAFNIAKNWQENLLAINGLENKWNCKITQLLLSQYGIKAEQKIEHEGNMNVEIVDYKKE